MRQKGTGTLLLFCFTSPKMTTAQTFIQTHQKEFDELGISNFSIIGKVCVFPFMKVTVRSGFLQDGDSAIIMDKNADINGWIIRFNTNGTCWAQKKDQSKVLANGEEYEIGVEVITSKKVQEKAQKSLLLEEVESLLNNLYLNNTEFVQSIMQKKKDETISLEEWKWFHKSLGEIAAFTDKILK